MQLALQQQRARYSAEFHKGGLSPDNFKVNVDQALYMATLGGTETIPRKKHIGGLEPGKYADFILIRVDSLSVTALVGLGAPILLHANPSNLETMILNEEVLNNSKEPFKVGLDDSKFNQLKIVTS
ncbi:uncharacterized protein K441DRAFT_662432 [Cenococcum geophilum 1.58]|uniref:uncharacterized protein n=1 Tax=Cenococcum geophilum 1.58 TaxID=794803 RepID=UPI00358EB966|nr:hypothetical protein K441DRAFT_662432 [Cenococcum geophilum 1.58]